MELQVASELCGYELLAELAHKELHGRQLTAASTARIAARSKTVRAA